MNAATQLIDITIPAGRDLGGVFTGFTIASGTTGVVIAYTA